MLERFILNTKEVKRTMPDFYIGAQAAVLNLERIKRDVTRYLSYFPTIKLITPYFFK
jgi:predicted nucleic acid-binding protein